MPTLTTTTSFSQPGEQYTLYLRVSHHVVLRAPGGGVYAVNIKQLQDLDIAPGPGGIMLTLRAAKYRDATIPASVLNESALSRHFCNAMKINLNALGIEELEEKVDEDRFSLIMHVNPPALSRLPQLCVHAIHLSYTWKATQEDAEPHLFSPPLLLPDASVLDSLFQRFVAHHLVGRYPLIFGPWCRRFEAERKVFPSIARSVLALAVRSPNASMRKSTCKLVARMRSSHECEVELVNSRLALLAPITNDSPNLVDEDTLSDMQAITFALERLYRRVLKPRRFKAQLALQSSANTTTTASLNVADTNMELNNDDAHDATDLKAHMGLEGYFKHEDLFSDEKDVELELQLDDDEPFLDGDDVLTFSDALTFGSSNIALGLANEDSLYEEDILLTGHEIEVLFSDDEALASPSYPASPTNGGIPSTPNADFEATFYQAHSLPLESHCGLHTLLDFRMDEDGEV